MRPCKQSVVLGTRITLAPSGTESSSSLQIMTAGQLGPRVSGENKLTGLTLSSSDLSEGRLDLGVKRVSGHDEDDWHVLVDKREGSVLELSSKDLGNQLVPEKHNR